MFIWILLFYSNNKLRCIINGLFWPKIAQSRSRIPIVLYGFFFFFFFSFCGLLLPRFSPFLFSSFFSTYNLPRDKRSTTLRSISFFASSLFVSSSHFLLQIKVYLPCLVGRDVRETGEEYDKSPYSPSTEICNVPILSYILKNIL